MIKSCRENRSEKESRASDVGQVTSQVIPICDISLEDKVHVQERSQLRQISKVSRLGRNSSRLIVELVD